MWRKIFLVLGVTLLAVMLVKSVQGQTYETREDVILPADFSVNLQLIDTSDFPTMRVRFSQSSTRGLPRWDKTHVKIYEDGSPLDIEMEFDPEPMTIVWLFDLGAKGEAILLDDFEELIASIGSSIDPHQADTWQFCSTRITTGCLEPMLGEDIRQLRESTRPFYIRQQYDDLVLGPSYEVQSNLETLLRLAVMGHGRRVAIIVKENYTAATPYFSPTLITEMLYSQTPLVFINRTQGNDSTELALGIQATIDEIGGYYVPNIELSNKLPDIERYFKSRRAGSYKLRYGSQLFRDGQPHTLKIVFDANGDGYNDYTKQEQFDMDTPPDHPTHLKKGFKAINIAIILILLVAPLGFLIIVSGDDSKSPKGSCDLGTK